MSFSRIEIKYIFDIKKKHWTETNSRSSIEVTNLEQVTGEGIYKKLLLPRSVFEVLYKAPTKLHDDLFTDISLLFHRK